MFSVELSWQCPTWPLSINFTLNKKKGALSSLHHPYIHFIHVSITENPLSKFCVAEFIVKVCLFFADVCLCVLKLLFFFDNNKTKSGCKSTYIPFCIYILYFAINTFYRISTYTTFSVRNSFLFHFFLNQPIYKHTHIHTYIHQIINNLPTDIKYIFYP